MSGWKAKRFWKEVQVVAAQGGYSVQLDGRPVKTPAKTLLVVPSADFAQAIAAEWAAQEAEVNPQTMPFTRAANAALDKVAPQFAEVADMIAAYGGTDLLCYRATAPQELIMRQAQAWDPLLDWAAAEFGARLQVGQGVMHVAQDRAALQPLYAQVHAMTPYQLTGFHDLVGISGSLIIGLAVAQGHIDAGQGWSLSRIDETWQAEQWGRDDEAEELAEVKRQEFLHAKRVFDLALLS